MVLAISVLEAPLKFRAEGLELRVGMAIGRIMFRALNVAEVLWVVVIALCLSVTGPSGPVLVLAALTAVLLAVQLLLVRPRLNRRSARVRVGQDAPRSLVHHARVGDRRRGFPGAPSGVSVIFDGSPCSLDASDVQCEFCGSQRLPGARRPSTGLSASERRTVSERAVVPRYHTRVPPHWA
jgi:hypothetical protein